MAWARILLLFEAFAGVGTPSRQLRDAFEASFVGDMSAPGSVRKGFRKGAAGANLFVSFFFLMGFV